jgi:hypothetical protein
MSLGTSTRSRSVGERRAQPVDREIAQAGALAKSLDTESGACISSWLRLTYTGHLQRHQQRCVSTSGVLLVRRSFLKSFAQDQPLGVRHPFAGVVGHDLDEVPPYVGRSLLERLPGLRCASSICLSRSMSGLLTALHSLSERSPSPYSAASASSCCRISSRYPAG